MDQGIFLVMRERRQVGEPVHPELESKPLWSRQGLCRCLPTDPTDTGDEQVHSGSYSTADVWLGSGHDSVTVEGRARLVLHNQDASVTATGGAGKDAFVFQAGSGHTVIEDFASGPTA